MRVFILDEIIAKPGMAKSIRDLFSLDYSPAARRRSMRAEGAWQNPPLIEQDGFPTTLYYLWSVDDVEAWWAMRKSKTTDGVDERAEKHAFWQKVDSLSSCRTRKFLSPLDEAT